MKTKVVSVLICLVLLLTFAPLPVMRSIQAQRLTPDDSLVEVVMMQMEEDEPGTPVVTGELGLSASVQVFPYDVDIYGIYLVEGDNVSLVTSVPVDHINADRVTAKLSPDGFKVAYLVEYGNTGFSRLVVVGVDGLNSNPLWESNDPGRYITSFSWSHDSERLAYALSSDPFGLGQDINASFENPDVEVDLLEETVPLDTVTALTGEVWITDLYGAEQEQLVDRGAMDVLGWTGNDTGVLFTASYVASADARTSSLLDEGRAITITSPFAGHVALVRTDAVTSPVVTTLFTNTAMLDEISTEPYYIAFHLLESATGEQKLAALSTLESFETLPEGDTTLRLADLSNVGNRIQTSSLTFVPVLTNTETIAHVQISPDGTQIAYVTQQNGGLWVASVTGLNHMAVVTQGFNTQTGVIWGIGNNVLGAMSLESHALHIVALDGTAVGHLSALPSEDLVAEPLTVAVLRDFDVPYIHQMFDLTLNGNRFDGRCACGPTSATMALAFYGKLPTDRGPAYYVAERFGNFQTGSLGNCPVGYGLYGSIVRSSAGAHAHEMQQALKYLGVNSTFNNSPQPQAVREALDRGHLVILSTRLGGYNHLVLVKGYASGERFIVHDPFGDANAANYGRHRNGANISYTWNKMNPTNKWMVEVHGTPPAPRITHWKGEYFNNINLSGHPALVRNDTSIDFNWGTGSPHSSINADNFSVRWTRTIYFQRGIYRFRTTTDDGVRLYVNNQLVINQWRDQAATVHESGDIFLPAGNATVRMEYYERGGAAVAKLDSRLIGTGSSGSGWRGEYFNNRTLSGNPTFVRNDDSIYFNWGSGGPGGGVSSDNFSVRWTRTVNVPRTGYYQFYARADDGVRVWVNNQLPINGWRDQAATTYGSGWIYLNQGNNSIKVEYYERTGNAYIRFWMVPAFYTQFYNNRTLSGNPSWTGHSPNVNFYWGYLGPPNTNRDNFSARFTGHAALSGGRYKFCVRTDDGVRLYIDNHLVINRWQDQPATTYCVDRDLARGFHEIKMEYYERGGIALAQLWWSRYSGSDALSAAMVVLDEPMEEFDIWALYGDSGYLGPLIESDITSLTLAPGNMVFLPLVLRQP